MENIFTNAFLETFFINQTPNVSNVLECPFLVFKLEFFLGVFSKQK